LDALIKSQLLVARLAERIIIFVWSLPAHAPWLKMAKIVFVCFVAFQARQVNRPAQNPTCYSGID